MTYSSCLHDQQDLCWGNTSRDTSEESQESQQAYHYHRTTQPEISRHYLFSIWLKGHVNWRLKTDIYLANFSRANNTFGWRMLIHLKRMKLWLFVKPYALNEKLITKKALKIKKFVDFRRSHRSAAEKGTLKHFANFTGKHLCGSLFLTKLLTFSSPTSSLKRDSALLFSCEIWKPFRNTCFEEHLRAPDYFSDMKHGVRVFHNFIFLHNFISHNYKIIFENNFWEKILPADCADTFLSFQSFEKFDFWKFYGFKTSLLKTKLLINYGR